MVAPLHPEGWTELDSRLRGSRLGVCRFLFGFRVRSLHDARERRVRYPDRPVNAQESSISAGANVAAASSEPTSIR